MFRGGRRGQGRSSRNSGRIRPTLEDIEEPQPATSEPQQATTQAAATERRWTRNFALANASAANPLRSSEPHANYRYIDQLLQYHQTKSRPSQQHVTGPSVQFTNPVVTQAVPTQTTQTPRTIIRQESRMPVIPIENRYDLDRSRRNSTMRDSVQRQSPNADLSPISTGEPIDPEPYFRERYPSLAWDDDMFGVRSLYNARLPMPIIQHMHNDADLDDVDEEEEEGDILNTAHNMENNQNGVNQNQNQNQVVQNVGNGNANANGNNGNQNGQQNGVQPNGAPIPQNQIQQNPPPNNQPNGHREVYCFRRVDDEREFRRNPVADPFIVPEAGEVGLNEL
ncbi:putative uncharacterized protein DDB_G0272516 [Planococcus citri]|uniref:putative uncharacterized protein DDB_G0272516 n=1 Tax=Planococcus citri TaxID=170843 RepID=UPI0031F77BE6